MNIDLGHWVYNGPEVDISKMLGFVYCISNISNNKKYIGKKLLLNRTCKKPLKGRTNKRRGLKASDWKEYTGSCPDLNDYILKNGKSEFTFEILSFHPSKLLLSYYEIKEIIDRNAIFSNDFYNQVLNCRFRFHK